MRPALVLVLTAGLLAAGPHGTLAQSSFGLGLGVLRREQADMQASPLRYGATAPSVLLFWHHDGRHAAGVSVRFTPARLSSRLPGSAGNPMRTWNVDLTGDWMRRLHHSARAAWHLGARLTVRTSLRRHDFAPTGGSEFYGDLIADVGPLVQWTWHPVIGQAVRQRLGVPLLSAALRTPYAGFKFMPPLMLGGPGRLLGLQYQLEYVRPISRVLAVGASYEFEAFHYPDPQSLSVVNHRVGAVAHLGGGIPR